MTVLVGLMLLSQLEAKNKCPKGMVWSECGKGCPFTCQDPAHSYCLTCQAGCVCDEGTLSLTFNSTVCVTPEKCPEAKSCPKGQTWFGCQQCPATCQDQNPGCLVCTPECKCDEGTRFINSTSKICVPVDKCPTIPPTTSQPTAQPTGSCPPTQVWSECASACPPTCQDPNGPICEACSRGCTCAEGTILLNKTSDVCVTKAKCPKTKKGLL